MNNKKRFWQNLNQLQDNNESSVDKKQEFLSGVTDKFEVNKMPELPRRKFLAALGASAAFISTSCTDYRDKGEIVSYNNKPENVDYGVANYYASSLNNGYGILIKTREGRPVKVDGNPDHPVNKSKIDNIGQASLLDLYDPARLKDPKKKSNGKSSKINWKVADEEIINLLNEANNSGKEIALITGEVISPSQNKLFDNFINSYPNARVYSYDVFAKSNKIKAWEKSYGDKNVPAFNIDEAKIILSLESDFLGSDVDAVENIQKFSKTRDFENLDDFSRLYSVEGNLSVTGTNGDYRLRLSPEKQYDFVLSVINELLKKELVNIEISSDVSAKVASHNLDNFASENNLDKKVLNYLVDDLHKNTGKSIVLAGDHLPEEVHSAVFMLNEIIKATDLYDLKHRNTVFRKLNTDKDWKDLINKINTGKVATVINFDVNPVYNLPKAWKFGEALSKSKVITFTEQENETSEVSDYIFPINHALESWGDFLLRDGIISTQQPVIAPLYNTRQKEAVLLTWANKNEDSYSFDIYHKFIQNRWKEEFYPALSLGFGFKDFWFSSLHDGVYKFDKTQLNGNTEKLSFNSESFVKTANSLKAGGYTLLLNRSSHLADGKYANNGWLQELPHPVSKVVWDNYAAVSPETASKLGAGYSDNISDLVEVTVNNAKLKLPVMVQPGLADNVISIELGYGRTKGGEIGTGVGFDGYQLMNSFDRIYTGASISKNGGTYQLVSTQEHHSLDDDFVKDFHRIRKIIRDGSIEEYKKNPKFIKEMALMNEKDIKKKNVNPVRKSDIKWAMAVDMSKCVGCNLCVSSCNVENNIPVVGKTETSKGREMHWMRIDRYYSGTPDAPIVSHQPMTCQHCDNAPCENVCPVVATTHSPDGLNQMTYNRCVGTRYCANNCPYKVRRFNFFDFRDWYADSYYEGDSLSLMHNPEVTVRSRGVMEKCTFCIQRIMEGRQEATKRGEEFTGSGVKTACQEACPADAITFGNMNDPESDIAKMREHNLEYKVLDQLGVRPNVSYMGKLRNIHTEEINSEQH